MSPKILTKGIIREESQVEPSSSTVTRSVQCDIYIEHHKKDAEESIRLKKMHMSHAILVWLECNY